MQQLLEWLPLLQSLEIDQNFHSLTKPPNEAGRTSSIVEYSSSTNCKLGIANLTTNAKWLERMKYNVAAEARS